MAIKFKHILWIAVALSAFGLIAFFSWQGAVEEYTALEPPPQ
ncbi:MAG: hypothetical protein ACR2P1_10140 [Pseudomonadales bacterium]